jgi:hypothetical protein
VIGLLLALLVTSVAQAQVSISYHIVAYTVADRNGVASSRLTPPRLCPGEDALVGVGLQKVVDGVSLWAWGGHGRVKVQDPEIGRATPAAPILDPPMATVRFEALAPGTTFLIVDFLTTGDEPTIPTPAIASRFVPVEVTDCYEAVTSGLGTQFFVDGKNMGGFNRPFLLSGSSNLGGVTAKAQNMFFNPGQREGPSPACPVYSCRGLHVFLETWSAGGGACSAYISGRYEVKFHIGAFQPGADVGDLEMSGKGQVFCGGVPGPTVDYEHSVGFLIAFRPRPPGP